MTNRARIPPRRDRRARSRQRTVRPAVRGRLPTSLSVTRRLGRGRARPSRRDACPRGPTVRPILYRVPVRPILGCIPATGPSVGSQPRGRYRDRACDGRIAVLVPRRSVVPTLPCGCGARPWLGPAWASSRITRRRSGRRLLPVRSRQSLLETPPTTGGPTTSPRIVSRQFLLGAPPPCGAGRATNHRIAVEIPPGVAPRRRCGAVTGPIPPYPRSRRPGFIRSGGASPVMGRSRVPGVERIRGGLITLPGGWGGRGLLPASSKDLP
jgi:hypothetical protein